MNSWERFPSDLRSRILDLSDALTQCLHRHGLYVTEKIQLRPKYQRTKRYNDIWEAALESEWDGDLAILPKEYEPCNEGDWLRVVKSKSVWRRLQRLDQQALKRGYDATCYSGHFSLALQFESLGIEISDDSWCRLTNAVAGEGNLEQIEYLAQTKSWCFSANTIDEAAGSGNLDLLKFVIKTVQENVEAVNADFDVSEVDVQDVFGPYTLINAARFGHLHIV
ncbi:hypothetical protein HDV05_008701, partial [Chytridiales sp. JEL 0842]